MMLLLVMLVIMAVVFGFLALYTSSSDREKSETAQSTGGNDD